MLCRDLKGVMTTLDDQGHLVCSYLGTDPSMFVTPTTESRDINYEEQDVEMKKLQRAIKDSASKQSKRLPRSNSNPRKKVFTL